MAIQYILSQRATFKADSIQHKYFAILQSFGNETLDNMSQEISLRTGVDESQIKTVLDAFIQLIPEKVTEGKVVEFGNLGSFFLTLRSDETDNCDNFDNSFIKGSRLNFYQNELVEKEFEKVGYQKITNI